MVKILNFCKKRGRFSVELKEKEIFITCPKLIDLCDEYTQKKIKNVGRVSGECRADVRVEEEVEEDKKPYTVTKDKDVNIKVKATDGGNGGSAISKQERKKAAAVLFGREEWITERPVSLAKAFEKEGYPINTTLAFIIQAKDKNNAPGWLTTVLSDAKYSPSDEAHERSKKAMRSAL